MLKIIKTTQWLRLQNKSIFCTPPISKTCFQSCHIPFQRFFVDLSLSFPFFPFPYAKNLPFSAALHFPILCITQYNSHWMLTFTCVLNVNRVIPLQYVIFANTGSIICSLLEYNFLYFGVSIFSLIFCERFSPYFDIGMYNVRYFFLLFLD